MWIGVIIAVLILLILWFIVSYNNFMKQKALVSESFSGMDVYLKKRYDLIPNLVECVKTYMGHERDTLEKVITLRNKAATCQGVAEQVTVQKELSEQLTRFFALAESYPDLKANQQFLSMQADLSTIEEDITQARKYYNGAVKQFNIRVTTTPSNFIAKLFHFTEYPYFEIQENERDSIKVEFK